MLIQWVVGWALAVMALLIGFGLGRMTVIRDEGESDEGE